ncbi:unnamed protein product [Fraxinus pennsylvanica]|uniref:Uncharacterized protein n=1 Tax=Fraxinus pennsylvanica TaxID=56036 RepID=A0AAD1ZJY0_9LAMI|nr:unnamed protein product [Fraxinus pennsylvanica]
MLCIQDDDGNNAFHIAADAAKRIRENLDWIIFMLKYPNAAVEVRNQASFVYHCSLAFSVKSLQKCWWRRESIYDLSPTIYQIGDWVMFRRSIIAPTYGWQGATYKSVGFVQSVQDKDNLTLSLCSGEAQVLANEVIKVIPLDKGQHVQLKPDVKEPKFGWRG